MARKVVGVPIGASFVTTMLTEFGPNGCTLGLGFLSDNTGITLQIVGAVSNTIYIDELLPAVEGISCNINDTSDTTVTITLTGTNVAGQLSLVTGPAASQPVPYAAPIVAANTVSTESTAITAGTAATYSRGDHAHGPAPVAPTIIVASATNVAISAANTLQTVATYDAPATGNYLVSVTVEIPTGGATITAQVSFTGDDGADTMTWVSAQTQAAGKWGGAAMIIPALAGTINIQVESSVATTTLASASIMSAS